MPSEPLLIASPSELTNLLRTIAGVPRIALDVEGNGLFAYRSRVCTLQLAWEDMGEVRIAIIDALEIDVTALAEVFSDRGPIKLLHDCTFDAKLLSEAGVTLERLRDTSVLGRMLGRKATGLASLLASELGLSVEKELQQHDWSRRPLGAREIAYLADDVRYLMALDDKLAAEVRARDIEEEVETESAFKLASALGPPRERQPAYLRIRGADKLDRPGLTVLRRLVEEREKIAAEWDQPPFKVASNEWLLAVARTKPAHAQALRQVRGGFSPRLLGSLERLAAAVRRGVVEPDEPAERSDDQRLDRAAAAARRGREKRLTAWRRGEATARGVDEQVVLPGHCLQELAARDPDDPAPLGDVPGLGAKRVALYGATLTALLSAPASAPSLVAAPSSEEPGG